MKLPSQIRRLLSASFSSLWTLVLLLSCFGTGNMEEQEHPIPLNGQNINNILATHEVVFVNFYAEWCRFSNILTPVFKETADKIKELFPQPGKVAFAKVDCDRETGISTQYHISKYPTLKLIRGGQIVKKEYRGQRSVDALTEYIKGQLADTIKKHTTMDELDELEEQKRNTIGYFADENTDTYKTFQRVASQLRDDCQFHCAVGEMTESERQGSDKIVFRPPKTRRQDQPYEGDLSNYEALLQWTQDKCVPLVREITFENAEELTEEGLPFLILFHKPDDTEIAERFTKAVMEQLLMEKHNVNFLTADGLKFSHPLHHLGKTSNDLPVLAIDSFRHMYIFKHDVKNDIDKPGLLKQFVDDLHSGKLHREFHHGPDPTPTPASPPDPNAKQHIPHDPSEKPEEPTNVPESSFVKLAPSENRYTIVRHRDEL